jgi:hypothetical protein
MLLPRYSLRWLLVLITASAGVSFILSFAWQGDFWAIGVMAGLGSVLLVMLLYALTFLTAWAVSQIEAAVFKQRDGTSPFATNPTASPFSPPEPGLATTTDGPPTMTG